MRERESTTSLCSTSQRQQQDARIRTDRQRMTHVMTSTEAARDGSEESNVRKRGGETGRGTAKKAKKEGEGTGKERGSSSSSDCSSGAL